MHYAHTLENAEQDQWHPLSQHLEGVASLAAFHARPFGGQECARCVGLVHDAGKFFAFFQKYLRDCHAGKNRAKGGDHAILGAMILCNEHILPYPLNNLLAYVVAGHHAGLPDGGPAVGNRASLQYRLKRCRAHEDKDCWRGHMELPSLDMANLLPIWLRSTPRHLQGFAFSFYARMIFSCLVDADCLHTEGFCSPELKALRDKGQPLEELLPLFTAHMKDVRKETRELGKARGSIASWRTKVAACCRMAASAKAGFFALTVPTGGGKTLASLLFALRHAKAQGMRRIIYVAPFTSIIDQNAREFRDIFGDNNVLEHHSNFDPVVQAESGAQNQKDHEDYQHEAEHEANAATAYRLATQNWDCPVIATTAVQFFESLFAARSGRCRKLHNIAQSVIILDEAQALPPDFLEPTLAALRELVRGYGVSIVLCTATQPHLDAPDAARMQPSAQLTMGFTPGEVREIVPLTRQKALFAAFERVRVRYVGCWSAATVAETMQQRAQVLCIVNTRKAAETLYHALDCPAEEKFHLSARMYPLHRKAVLAQIQQRLDSGLPCRVVSTQLIEAGVNIDFPVVLRALAGLDSIAQAAGRCNRHGLSAEPGDVLVYKPEEGLPSMPFFSRRAEIGEVLLQQYDNVLLPEVQKEYFRRLFNMEEMDAKDIMREFAFAPENCVNEDLLSYSFRSIAHKYRFIEDGMVSLVVEVEGALPLVQAVEEGRANADVFRKLQGYTVQVYPFEAQHLHLREVGKVLRVLSGATGYRQDTGVAAHAANHRSAEDNCF